jgi:hypothetical protein
MRRQKNVNDPRSRPNLVTGEYGLFGANVSEAIEARPIVKIITAIRPKPPLQNVMGIKRRRAAVYALAVVAP